ncbi:MULTISPECIES: DISARM system phospholipase D-like protein DrmC [Aeromonas]|uniref:DISARM system phospholipase D-like protein DrmC n=1 Tax=Aeromonas TaxID=642 RepID=UPI00043B0442|nr:MULTISPECIES: DISARM system phospholipase D-like protein DrmC [Aeromonas]AHV36243.1 phospholipase [Aeromonas hydrophila YL17]MDM5123552.1 DISARM system phospholipase D-like protein DrmC [Aeromonas rivipollensis]QDO77239.1 phospholipase [Aeromonas caviae]
MDELLDAITAVVSRVSPEKVRTIAERTRRTDTNRGMTALCSAVGTPTATIVVEKLVLAWQKTSVSPDELASMLLTAAHVYTKATAEQSTELVWTGPTTPFVSARRTEQALLQVINSAKRTLFITSFVAYDVSTIVTALNEANERGVAISMLLELSQDQGGSITFDAIAKMMALVPSARLYAWHEKSDPFSGGSVHAKVVVADDRECFITSANLTGHAMEKNMEVGLLISGGHIPKQLHGHLRSLVDTKLVKQV